MTDLTNRESSLVSEGKWQYIITPSAIILDTELTANAKVIYCYLEWRAGKERVCWPGLRRMATELGISVATITTSIRKLEDRGYIVVEREKSGQGDYAVNRYTIKAPRLAPEQKVISEGVSKIAAPPSKTDTGGVSKIAAPPSKTDTGGVSKIAAPVSQKLAQNKESVEQTNTKIEVKSQVSQKLAQNKESQECPRCTSPKDSSPLEKAIQLYHDRYKERHGICPLIAEKMAHGIMVGLLKAHANGEEVEMAISAYIESEDPWLTDKGWDIRHLPQHFNACLLAAKKGEKHGLQGKSGKGGRRRAPSPRSEFGPGGLVR